MNWKDYLTDTGRGYFTLGTEDIGSVPVRLFLTPALLDIVEDSIYPQIVNAARFPGARMVAITPDVHHGYGVPIGTVLLTDAATGSVAMGPVGYDIGCFTGDTLVPTLDGSSRTLSAMEASAKPQWIYSLTPDHRVVGAKAVAKLTRQRSALVRVTLDNGRHVDCTPDHRFMLRDGSWREAQELRPGTSLMPLYNGKREGYRVVKHPATGTWQAVHWVLGRQGLLGEIPSFPDERTVIHHKDFDPANNIPDNLEFRGHREHIRYHHSNGRHNIAIHRDRLEPARVAALAAKAKTPDGKAYFAVRGTINILRYMKERQEHFKVSVAGNGQRGRVVLIRYNQSEKGRAKSTEIAHRWYECDRCGERVQSGFGIHNHRRRVHGYNHKVVGVRILGRKADVYCLTVPEYGNFALDAGVFVHNCGMMSASSEVPVAAATPENRLRFNREVTRRVALGPGQASRTPLKNLSRIAFEAIIRGGAGYYVEKYGSKVERTRSERDGIPVDDSWQPLWGGPGRPERGVPQLATLGGGNHFIELQGNINTDTLYVQMHSGSRGFGHGLATNYFHLARAENASIKALDLGYFTPDSPHYRSYLNAVAAGANFAIVNRFTMFEQIALAFEDVFRQPLSLVYEISHNLVQREFSPEFGWVHVHRKGATRAFPAGHDFLKGTPWEAIGHPVLIPGSNHDSSFILRATPGASISGYSVNHGAGRRMSRGAARKTLVQRQVDDEYRAAGIVVNLDGHVPIDESRDAYKSSREVVEAVTRAGLATIEHELLPLASIKGNE
ncbi:MAG TPA: RtcB family protein [Candidatus Dormibacteraeota bacterium]